eukprot:ANDGO_03148.mRNA.1 Pre-rRNA-processing protein TSR1 homolog
MGGHRAAKASGRMPSQMRRTNVKSANRSTSKQDRKNKAVQIRKTKIAQAAEAKRIGSAGGPPRVVAIVPLSPTVDALPVLKAMLDVYPAEPNSTQSAYGPYAVNAKQWKHSFSIVAVKFDQMDIMTAAKVADVVIAVVPGTGFDDDCRHISTILLAQGCPSVIGCIQGIEQVQKKLQGDMKKIIQEILENTYSEEVRVVSADSAADVTQMFRWLSSVRLRSVHWRERNGYMLVDSVTVDEHTGAVVFGGFIRGSSISANQLFHVSRIGTFQCSRITCANGAILDAPSAQSQESLQAENELDPMAGEQTWPTEEEYKEAERKRLARIIEGSVKRRKIPKGVSEYQAAWISDDEKENDEDADRAADDHSMEADDAEGGNDDNIHGDEEEEEDDDDEEMQDVEDADGTPRRHDLIDEMEEEDGSIKEEEAEDDGEDSDDEDSVEGAGLDMDKHFKQNLIGGSASKRTDDDDDTMQAVKTAEELEAERLEYMQQVEDHEKFPDEVDTPFGQSCRMRFARYRGLKSFRFSKWDPMENLPRDYARIFQFENFKHSQSRALQLVHEFPIRDGTYVQIHLQGVDPRDVDALANSNSPVILSSLNRHEQKMSMLHFRIERFPQCTDIIKSKTELVFCCGFRNFVVHPIFSEINPRGDKSRFERYLPEGGYVCASAYMPVTFVPTTTLVFQRNESGQLSNLVATGSLMSVDPNRLVLKRVILSGHPFRIYKRHAVVRFMFFNPEDIRWFKPVELRTKMGLHGHIKEPVGTHGYMKCRFDKLVKGNDTILMCLYKRVFPKWDTRFLSVREERSSSQPTHQA